MRFFFCAILLLGLVSCSSTKMASQRFVVEKRWARNTLQQEFLEGRRIHRFSPILTDSLVIVGNSIDGVVAYDRKSVHERWRLNIKDGSEGGAVLADGMIYFGAGDGQLYAVQVEDGKIQWTYPLKAEGIAKPLVHAGILYVLAGNNVVHAVNAKSGKLMWVYNRREAGNLSVRGGSQPAMAGDLLIVGFSDGAAVALNRSSGTLVWETNLNRNKRFRDVDASPVVDGNNIYISSYDGALYSLRRSDGQVQWSVDDGGYDDALVQGSQLFYTSSSGKTMALDKASGRVLWTRVNPKGIAMGPVMYKGVLIVGEMSGALRFIDARSGDLLGQFEPGRGVTSRPAVDTSNNEVYFVSTDANVFALRAKWQRFAKDWPWED